MNKRKIKNEFESSRIQKGEGKIRDFCGEVLWQIAMPSKQGPYLLQLIKVSETSAIEKEVI